MSFNGHPHWSFAWNQNNTKLCCTACTSLYCTVFSFSVATSGIPHTSLFITALLGFSDCSPSALTTLEMKTQSILGFASEPWSSTTGQWYDTRLGGPPLWPGLFSPSIPECPLCSSSRLLVLQAYAPHPAHPERSILLFGCNSIRCSVHPSAWFALRVCNAPQEQLQNEISPFQVPSQRDEAHNHQAQQPTQIDWDTDSDHSDSDDDLAQDLAALSLKVQAARDKCNIPISKPKSRSTIPTRSHPSSKSELPSKETNSRSDTDNSLNHFNSVYIEVEEESKCVTDSITDQRSVSLLLQKYEEEEKKSSSKPATESFAPEADDDEIVKQTFDDFYQVISRCPQQLLRYSFAGQPVWPRHPPPQPPSELCHCGSKFVFELELLGSCLNFLRPDEVVPTTQKEAGMNFAALAIYTCEADCTRAPDIYESPPFRAFAQKVCLQQDDW